MKGLNVSFSFCLSFVFSSFSLPLPFSSFSFLHFRHRVDSYTFSKEKTHTQNTHTCTPHEYKPNKAQHPSAIPSPPSSFRMASTLLVRPTTSETETRCNTGRAPEGRPDSDQNRSESAPMPSLLAERGSSSSLGTSGRARYRTKMMPATQKAPGMARTAAI